MLPVYSCGQRALSGLVRRQATQTVDCSPLHFAADSSAATRPIQKARRGLWYLAIETIAARWRSPYYPSHVRLCA